ncbi:MAG: prepilin-type N-terminal cleavage/methylation domain-containing protein [Ruthenibacterium sp.]
MKYKKGFTLIELIVVLAIVAVIAAIAVPTAFGSIEKANIAADKASIEALNSAIRTAAIIERADAAINNATMDDIAKKRVFPCKVKQACEAASISPDSGILSKGGVRFIPASEKTIAHFEYSDKPTSIIASGGTVFKKGDSWRSIYTWDADKFYCNYFAY